MWNSWPAPYFWPGRAYRLIYYYHKLYFWDLKMHLSFITCTLKASSQYMAVSGYVFFLQQHRDFSSERLLKNHFAAPLFLMFHTNTQTNNIGAYNTEFLCFWVFDPSIITFSYSFNTFKYAAVPLCLYLESKLMRAGWRGTSVKCYGGQGMCPQQYI